MATAFRESPVLTTSGEPYRVPLQRAPRRRDVNLRYDVLDVSSQSEPYWALADALGPRAAANPYVRAKLRERARVILSNNCYAAAIVRAKANYVVGAGARVQVLTDDRKYNQTIERLFHDWCDYVGFWEKLRLQREAWAGDGESFGVIKANRGVTFRHQVKIDYEVVEPEVFSDPSAEMVNDVNREDGIVLDDYGNVIAYRKYKRHPEDSVIGYDEKPETILAKFVVHLFRVSRGGQLRGIPEITPSLMLYPLMRRWTLATLNAAENAARISGFMQVPVVGDDAETPEAGDTFDLPMNTWLTLPEGAEPKQMTAEHPTTTYPMLKQEVTAECARCLDMPYNIAAGDSGDLNFASGKLDLLPFRRSNECDQRVLNRKACRPVFEVWFEYASAITGYLPEPPAGVVGAPPTNWMWGQDEPIDPREAGANLVRLQSGQTTLARLHAGLGLDSEQELEEGARALGLTIEQYRENIVRTIWKQPTPVTDSGSVSEAADDEKDAA